MSSYLAYARAEHQLVDLMRKNYLVEIRQFCPQIARMWVFLIKAIREQRGDDVNKPVINLSEIRTVIGEDKSSDFKILDDDFSKMLGCFEQQLPYEENFEPKLHIDYFARACQVVAGERKSWVNLIDNYGRRFLFYILTISLITGYLYISYVKDNWNPFTWNQIRFGNFWIVAHRQDLERLELNRAFDGSRLKIGDVEFDEGLATHANSEIILKLPAGTKYFSGMCGMSSTAYSFGRFTCIVKQGANELFKSDLVSNENLKSEFLVEVDESDQIVKLIVNSESDLSYDHAVWTAFKAS